MRWKLISHEPTFSYLLISLIKAEKALGERNGSGVMRVVPCVFAVSAIRRESESMLGR